MIVESDDCQAVLEAKRSSPQTSAAEDYVVLRSCMKSDVIVHALILSDW